MRVKDFGGKKVILYTLGHPGNESTISFYQNIGFDLVSFDRDFFIPDYHRVTFIRTVDC